jgi:hypothetical protein
LRSIYLHMSETHGGWYPDDEESDEGEIL